MYQGGLTPGGDRSSKRSPNSFFFFAYKKAEKVTTALYLITNLMPFEEPLRWQMRHAALSLIGGMLPLKDTGRGTHIETTVIPIVSELLSLIEVGRAAELISAMNTELVSRELSELGRAVREQYGGAVGGLLAPDFFSVLEGDHHTALLVDTTEREHGAERGSDGLKDIQSPSQGQFSIKDTQGSSQGHREGRKELGESSSSPKESARERKTKIVALLRKKTMLSVRDIGRAVGGYSEKTIQRDLNTLVAEGRVKQEGKRRWTRYSLKV